MEEKLELPPHGPRQPKSSLPRGPDAGEEGLPIYGPPTPAWLRLGAPASISAEPGEQIVWWRLPVPCAPLWTPSQRLRVRFMASRESAPGSFKTGGRGWTLAPLGRTRPRRYRGDRDLEGCG